MIEWQGQHLNITEKRYSGLHAGQNATDDAGKDASNSLVYRATCNWTVIGISSIGNGNGVYFYSDSPVQLRNGKWTRITMLLWHMNTIWTYKVGSKVKVGQFLYQEGTSGFATGNHIHMELIEGRSLGRGNLNVEDVFYVNVSKTNIINTRGLRFSTYNPNVSSSNKNNLPPFVFMFEHMNGNTYYMNGYNSDRLNKDTKVNNVVKYPYEIELAGERSFYLKRDGGKLTKPAGKFTKGTIINGNVAWRNK